MKEAQSFLDQYKHFNLTVVQGSKGESEVNSTVESDPTLQDSYNFKVPTQAPKTSTPRRLTTKKADEEKSRSRGSSASSFGADISTLDRTRTNSNSSEGVDYNETVDQENLVGEQEDIKQEGKEHPAITVVAPDQKQTVPPSKRK